MRFNCLYKIRSYRKNSPANPNCENLNPYSHVTTSLINLFTCILSQLRTLV
nr:MAG TPA: hypothetical protein [Caudoviricetes sp.]